MRNTVEAPMDFKTHISALTFPPDIIATKTAAISATVLARSKCISEANFNRIGVDDLRLLFDLYDAAFFGGLLGVAFKTMPNTTLKFRLAPRMTSAGAKTYRYFARGTSRAVAKYEIAVSTHLLFSNFNTGDGPATINGIECCDRLQALQRIFEHEIIHLVELVLTRRSSCKAEPFKTMARRLFGHMDTTHMLTTVRVRASRDLGLLVGDRVAFMFEGVRHEGILNRIVKRATVLVESTEGRLYSNGHTYKKFYVPLPTLTKVSSTPTLPSSSASH